MRTYLLVLSIIALTNLNLLAQPDNFPIKNIPTEMQGGFPQHIKEIVQSGTNFFAILSDYEHQYSQYRLFKSSDNGQNWAPIPFFDDKNVLNIRSSGDTIWVVTVKAYAYTIGVNGYRSTNGGQTFNQVLQSSETIPYGYSYFEPDVFEEAGNVMLLSVKFGTGNGQYYRHYYSLDRGATWTIILNNYTNRFCKTLYANGWFYRFQKGSSLVQYAITPDFANTLTLNLGATEELLEAWQRNDSLFTVGKSGRVYFKKAPFNSGSFQLLGTLPSPIYAAKVHNGFCHYFTLYGAFYRAPLSAPANAVATGFYPYLYSYTDSYYPTRGFGALGNRLYLFGKVPLRSDDEGLTWDFPTENIPRMTGSLERYHQELWMRQGFVGRYRNGAWHALQASGLLTTTSYQWDKVADIQGALFVMSKDIAPSKLYRSNDGGDHWTFVRDFDGFCTLNTDMAGKRLVVSIYVNGVPNIWYSNDLGATWALIPGAHGSETVLMKGDTVYAAKSNKLFVSFNLGQQWQANTLTYPVPPIAFPAKTELFWQDDRLLLAAGSNDFNGGHAYLSLDQGQSFLNAFDFDEIYRSNSLLVFSDQGYTYFSKNLGINGLRFVNNDWKFRRSYSVDNGFLYSAEKENGSNAIIDRVMRTPLSNLLDSLTDTPTGFVKGQVFLDPDQNCNLSAGDTPLSGQLVVFQPGNYIAVSGPDGSIYRPLPTNNYSIELTPPPFVVTSQCIDPATVLVGADSTRYFNIGLNATTEPDLEVSLAHSNIRPGFIANFTFVVHNVGFVETQGTTLHINFPDNILAFLSSDLPPHSMLSGSLEFQIPPLAPLSGLTFNVLYKVPSNTSLIGAIVHVDASLLAPYSDVNNANNMAQATTMVTGSFDPNDKTAITAAAPYDLLPLADKSLLYRIRFQNTGTDTAFTVVVVDTLSDRLDWSSFKMIGASHPYKLSVHDPGVLVWKFDPALLPDSNTNESTSHGYILFSIKAKPNVQAGEYLQNQAAIYFDYNVPVFTNTTQTKVVRRVLYRENELISSNAGASGFAMSPNPATDYVQLRFGQAVGNSCTAWLSDGLGRVVGRVQIPEKSETFDWSLAGLASGVYWLYWRDGEQFASQRLVLMRP
ncbi:MAG: hypothetical protein WCR52_16985 [Bacteroidota bacterium]